MHQVTPAAGQEVMCSLGDDGFHAPERMGIGTADFLTCQQSRPTARHFSGEPAGDCQQTDDIGPCQPWKGQHLLGTQLPRFC